MSNLWRLLERASTSRLRRLRKSESTRSHGSCVAAAPPFTCSTAACTFRIQRSSCLQSVPPPSSEPELQLPWSTVECVVRLLLPRFTRRPATSAEEIAPCVWRVSQRGNVFYRKTKERRGPRTSTARAQTVHRAPTAVGARVDVLRSSCCLRSCGCSRFVPPPSRGRMGPLVGQ